MFYTIPTARVIFMKKTSLDALCLRQKHVWTCSVLVDYISKPANSSNITPIGIFAKLV